MNNDRVEEVLKKVIWAIVEKNYNIDKQSPRVLTYKHIAMPHNPIDEIAIGIKQVVEQLLTQLIAEQRSQKTIENENLHLFPDLTDNFPEDQEDTDGTDDDDNFPYGGFYY